MSEEDTPSSITPSGRIVRWFVGGLPLGLVLMGALSFVFYFNKRNKPDVQPVEFAAMLQKNLNVEDFQRYVRVLQKDLGERTLRQPDNLEAAAAFMESTMGADNMGYATLRQEYDEAGKPLENVIAQLAGKSLPGDAIVVLTSHDSSERNTPDEAAGSALMLCEAHQLTGNPQNRTIVFLSVANAHATREDANGCWQAAQHGVFKDLKIVQFIVLEPADRVEADHYRFPELWKDVPLVKVPVKATATLVELHAFDELLRKAAQ